MKNLSCISSKELWHFIVDEPLLAHFFMRSEIREVKDFNGVAAVRVSRGKVELILNPAVISLLSPSEKIGVLVHEYLHILLRHCTKRAKHRTGPKAIKENIAMDLAINQLIRNNWGLPTFAVFHDRPPYDLPPRLSGEQYFDLIDRQFSDKEFEDMYGSAEVLDQHNWEPSRDDDAVVGEMIRSYLNSKRGDRLGKTIQSSGMARGILQEIVAEGSSEINWAMQAKKFLAKTASHKRIRSYKRPSRRYGFPFQGPKFKQATKAVAIVDTSLSITNEMLAYILTNLNAMSVVMEVDVLMCDAECHGKVAKFKPSEKIEFKGRGGTDLQPAFDKAVEEGYKAAIVFTDGDLFRDAVSDIPTLWVVLGKSSFKPTFGEVCHVDW